MEEHETPEPGPIQAAELDMPSPLSPDDASELTTDDLFADAVDEELADQRTKELLLPVGTWTTVPSTTSKFRHTHRKDVVIDRLTKERIELETSRLISAAFFRVQLIDRQTGLVKENGAIRLELSKEERKNDKQKWDLKTRLFLSARTAAKRAGVYNGTTGSIFKYMEDYPVNLRITQFTGDDGETRNLVMNISTVRPSS